jgi:outer membrane protein TolC
MTVYEINQLLGRERGAPLGVPAEVEFIPYSVEPEQLYALAEERHPQFSAFRTTIRRNERSIDLARKMYYPELNAEIGYGQRNMMPDVLSAQLTLAIPIWKNRKQSREVEEMVAMKNASEQALHDYKTMVTMQIQSLTAMANEHSQRIKLLTEVIIPQAQQTLEAALAAYSVNKGDFQMILDDQIELLMFEVDYYMLLAEYHKSLSKLDYYTAKSLNAN